MTKFLTACLVLSAIAKADLIDRPPFPYTQSLPFPYTAEQMKQAERHSERIQKQIDQGGIPAVRILTEQALDVLLRKAAFHMEKAGHKPEADEILRQWDETYQFELMETVTRDIGDHPPLSDWLAVTYMAIELALGVETCKSLHLSDIKTINYAIPVVFKPCTFPMDGTNIPRKDEYRMHFAEGKVYYGLIPVVTYWAVEIPCMIGASGFLSLVCSPVASIAEYVCAKKIAPPLSDKIYERTCEQRMV